MATYNLGRILPVFKGAFNSEESYNRLDIVYVSSYGSYVCNTDGTTTSPVNDSVNWVLINRDITNAQAWDEFVQAEAERDTLVNNLVTNGQADIDDFIEDATIRVNNTISGAEGEMVQIGQEWDTLKGEMEQYGGDVSIIQAALNNHVTNTDIHVTAEDKARWDAGSGSGFSGDYNDLINKPTIPSKTSDLTNDSGFINQLKTINNESLIGTGNITIEGSDFSGSYNDLTDKPTIPSKTSDLTNDSGFISQIKTINNQSLIGTGNLTIDTFSGDYDDLTNKPTIPSKTSDLTNDSNFVSSSTLATVATSGDYDDLLDKPTIPTKTSDLTNDSNFVSSSSLDPVAFSGDYNDLGNLPDIPTKTSDLTNDSGYINQLKTINNESLIGTGNITISGGGTQVQSDWTETDSTSMAYILHKPTLSTVATSGSYNDLSNKPTIPTKTSELSNDSDFISQIKTINNQSMVGSGNITVSTFSGSYNDLTDKPTIPTVGNGTITITQGGTTKGTFTLNQSGNSTIALDAGGSGSGDVTADGDNTFTGTNTFTTGLTIGGAEEEGAIGIGISSDSGSVDIAINQMSLSNTRGNQFSLVLTEEFDDELQEYNLQTIISTYNLNIVNPTEGATASVSIDGYQVLTTNDVATVATSGSYNDLTNKPTLATVATSGSYNDLTNKPTLATVATSGSYNDLTNKPSMSTETLTFIDDNNVSTTVVVYTQPTV